MEGPPIGRPFPFSPQPAGNAGLILRRSRDIRCRRPVQTGSADGRMHAAHGDTRFTMICRIVFARGNRPAVPFPDISVRRHISQIRGQSLPTKAIGADAISHDPKRHPDPCLPTANPFKMRITASSLPYLKLHSGQTLQPMDARYRGTRPSCDTVPTRFDRAKTAFVATPETNLRGGPHYPCDAASMMAELCPNAGRIRTFV